MKIIYSRAISKDVRKIKDKSLQQDITKIINDLKAARSIKELKNTKKLIGFKDAYRIKIGKYRLGFFLEDDSIFLARLVKRGEIYKVFP
ncbi:type II toxin-antitoxin system RelE family toxin [Autumnicola edwardsiae]|uniref:Type II toxin-antitoxin system RelE/ParE family toxin n=1 Tax=Autumnicola edwardsiae TaxID=3075594 RepID=A0ABU3CQC5_9FLAO|nr:type II toxin-antitoxin system RelE/ParE family toxin [Zunongwangia sp. F297]MDT0648521.1 type II toxin-antitoxin system RelE/ParE family toxin [Zunongwangia sp. F297]